MRSQTVVTAQGLTRKEKSLGYATQQVKAEELQAVRQTDLNNALVGKISGIRYMGGSVQHLMRENSIAWNNRLDRCNRIRAAICC